MRKLLFLTAALGGSALAGGCVGAGAQHAGIAPAQAGTPPLSPAAQNRELLPDEQVQQVLNRLTFGPRPGEAEQVRAMGVDRWIDMQLHPDRIPDAAADSLMARYSAFQEPTSAIVQRFSLVQRLQRQVKAADAKDSAAGTTKPQERRALLAQNPQLAQAVRENQQLVGQIQSAELARAVVSNRELNEVMVDFWENHFSVYAGKGQTRLFLASFDRDAIRPYALGKFRDLLGAVAKSPAMLFFLDNWESVADSTEPTLAQARAVRGRRPAARVGIFAGRGPLPPRALANLPPAIRDSLVNATPEHRQELVQRLQKQRARRGLNENYGRELMELHTLGVDGGYTQHDVTEVARALTGWTFNRQTGQFMFVPAMHDAGPKVILGQKFPAGHGEDEGERVLDMLASSPSTAHFITTKLARHFVSDDPPKALVDRCADTFLHTQGDIRQTLGCIIESPEFFSRAAYRAKVKTPFEVVASALRAVGAQPDTTTRSAQLVARLGEPIFGRQTPDGWPDRGDAWMNTGAILNRINFGLAVAAGQVPGARLVNWSEFTTLRPLPRAEQVDSVVKYMLGGQVAPETRAVLLSGTNPMMSKANDVNGMAADPESAMAPGRAAGGRGGRGGLVGIGRGNAPRPAAMLRPVNLQGLPQVVGLALGAPEFQRR